MLNRRQRAIITRVAVPWKEDWVLHCDGRFYLFRDRGSSFESNSDFEDVAKPRGLPLSRPDLQLTLPRACGHNGHISVVDFASHIVYQLSMGPVEAVRDLEYRSKAKHRGSLPAVEPIVVLMIAPGSGIVRF